MLGYKRNFIAAKYHQQNPKISDELGHIDLDAYGNSIECIVFGDNSLVNVGPYRA